MGIPFSNLITSNGRYPQIFSNIAFQAVFGPTIDEILLFWLIWFTQRIRFVLNIDDMKSHEMLSVSQSFWICDWFTWKF